jgi:hypothetical protein
MVDLLRSDRVVRSFAGNEDGRLGERRFRLERAGVHTKVERAGSVVPEVAEKPPEPLRPATTRVVGEHEGSVVDAGA